MQKSRNNYTEQTSQEKCDKNGNFKSKLHILLIVFLGSIIILYFMLSLFYQKVFFPGTIVNGINISGLNLSQARDAINATAEEYILTIEESGIGTEQISGSSIGLCVEDDDFLPSLLHNQRTFTWGLQAFHKKEYSLEMRYDKEKLQNVINALNCMEESTWRSSEDAQISYDKENGYHIIPEVSGTEIMPKRLLDAVAEALCLLENKLSLEEAGVYKSPKITSDDPFLQKQLSLLQSYSDMTVTYQFGSQTEVLDSDTISEWISVSKSGRRTIDREAVTGYVKELAKKHNTAYSPKTLETSYGETVTIKNGYYGWLIDKEAEVDALMAILREGKSVTKEPAYSMEAASHDGPDYGDTYVEINLTAQHLFYYKDGELVIESDFVSGNPSRGNDTPGGAYSITYKERNATLKGQNYRTPVSYWMPFNGNIGMHDSSWRSTFGGSIYKTNGSHGCINLPPKVAETIFENIEQGVPVFCYHLGGTEQAHATNLSGDQVITPPAVPEVEPEIVIPPEGAVPPDGQVLPEGELLPPQADPAPEAQPAPAGNAPLPDMPAPAVQ